MTRAQVSDGTPDERRRAAALCEDIAGGRHIGLLAALTRDSPRWISCEGLQLQHAHAGAQQDSHTPVERLQRAVSVDLD